MPERLLDMSDPDTQVAIQNDGSLDEEKDAAVQAAQGIVSASFRDNGKNGIYKAFESPYKFDTKKGGRWVDKDVPSYRANLRGREVTVLGEKDFFVRNDSRAQPLFKVFYLKEVLPEVGNPVISEITHKTETEVVLETAVAGEILHKLPEDQDSTSNEPIAFVPATTSEEKVAA